MSRGARPWMKQLTGEERNHDEAQQMGPGLGSCGPVRLARHEQRPEPWAVSQGKYETTLIIDARPLQAQVRVDGRPIGSAGELVAMAISMLLGPHRVEISAPGFHRYVGQFTADTGSAVNQFVVTLAPRYVADQIRRSGGQ